MAEFKGGRHCAGDEQHVLSRRFGIAVFKVFILFFIFV